MVFSSIFFLLYFLPVFLLVYHLVGKRWKNHIILIFSIFFYAWGAPKFIFIILGATFIDFYVVQFMAHCKNELHKKLLLTLSIATNLGLLLYFKYANFFVENVNLLIADLGMSPMAWTSVVLPIGISFYTFQTLTYSIDVYRKVHQPLKRVTDYLVYILSFPQMIAGPIVRFNSIAEEIVHRKETYNEKLIGFYRFSIGLAKKVLIANAMGAQADAILSGDLASLTTGEAWLGVLAYTFQIYFDFSGYSDMAIGLGKMMGFHFPENFNHPYISKNISEFWRRWHMTLGAFMRDYLYIPLGGNRVKTTYRLYFNLWIVFLLSGLWHGAAWNFLLWGAFHGFFLILDRLFLIRILDKLGKLPSIFFTFLVVMLGWVLFRIENFSNIQLLFKKMFSFQTDFHLVIPNSFWWTLVFAILFSFFAISKIGKCIANFFFDKENYSLKSHIGYLSLSLILFIFSLSYLTSSGFNPFIYFRF